MFITPGTAVAILVPVVVALLVILLAKPGYRTVIFNLIFGIPSMLAEIANALVGFNWSSFMPPREAAEMGLVILVLNTMFRFISSGPVGGGK